MKQLKKLFDFCWKYKYLLFIFMFCMLVLVYFGFSRNIVDSIWNYGFSFAMANGQMPYKDFTMIVPPFYNFIMSIGLRFINDNNIVFLIEQAFLITIIFELLKRMYKDNAWLFLVVMCFPMFVAFCPTYNFFLFFLFVVILYLEKNKKSDYLIGIFLAFMVLTKYTVGVFFVLPTFILFFKDKKKIFKRFIGFIIPCFIFLIYLILSDSFIQFIDLCFLGMFDFAKENTILFTPLFFISLIMFLISFYCVIKDKKDILNWYVFFSVVVMLPIFTRYHFYVYVLFFSLLFISKNIQVKGSYIRNMSLIICFIVILFNFVLNGAYINIERFDGINNFNFYYALRGSKNNFYDIDSLYDKYNEKGNLIVLSLNSAFLKIVNEDDFTYFTILNKGNYGFNGTKKMIDKISKMKDCYFMIFMNDYYASKNNIVFNYERSQFDCEIVDYIMENSELVESIYEYNVYYYKG